MCRFVCVVIVLFAAVLQINHADDSAEDVYDISEYYSQNPWRTINHRSAGCVCRPKRECPYALVNFSENCGYHRYEPFVCCGFGTNGIRRRRIEQDERNEQHQRKIREDLENNRRLRQDDDSPWVWDVEPAQEHISISLVKDHRHGHSHWDAFLFEQDFDDQQIDEYHRQTGISPNRHKHWLFNFEDPNTLLNHPPSISDEFALPDHLADIDPVVSQPAGVGTNTDATTTPAPTTTTAQPITVQPSSANINDPSCGISISNRIIGGENAVAMQFPWIARLAYRNRSK